MVLTGHLHNRRVVTTGSMHLNAQPESTLHTRGVITHTKVESRKVAYSSPALGLMQDTILGCRTLQLRHKDVRHMQCKPAEVLFS